MIYIENVQIVWINNGTIINPYDRIYGRLIVDYRLDGMEGHVSLDIPESVAMNLTLKDIRERVVLKLREVQ